MIGEDISLFPAGRSRAGGFFYPDNEMVTLSDLELFLEYGSVGIRGSSWRVA